MTDLSILIPARNEMFLARTIQDILDNMVGDTEIIAVLDGHWADPPIPDNPRVHLVYHPVSIGQRAATNEAARISTAKYIMKVDAHCSFDEGFDYKLMMDCEPDWTVIPRMYNLHAFDWVCPYCEERIYQGPFPEKCPGCKKLAPFRMDILWKAKPSPTTDYARFDKDLRFQYWMAYKKRPSAKNDIDDVMSSIGACWMMHRDRYWEIGGCDEEHGSWGQMGTEIACKTWLSGGRQVVNKKTWFAHMFRTQKGFTFPYPQSGNQVNRAREYSHQLWIENKWDKAIRPLSWLIDKFSPVPDWHLSKGVVYYTDNRLDERIFKAGQAQLQKASNGHEIISVSLKKLHRFGRNIVLDRERGILTMFKQILAGLKKSTADIVFLCEHDILYHPTHFDFMPARKDVYYYNENTWKVHWKTGQALFYYTKQTSGLCAYRELLLQHYHRRVQIVERDGFTRRMGFEPGSHNRKERVDDIKAERWMSEYPNIDIRHNNNLTPSRWSKDKFRNQKFCQGWLEKDYVMGWGQTKGRFDEILDEVLL